MLKKIYHLIFAGLLLIFLYAVYEAIIEIQRASRIEVVFSETFAHAHIHGNYFDNDDGKRISTWVVFTPPNKNIEVANRYSTCAYGKTRFSTGLTGNSLVSYVINQKWGKTIVFEGIVEKRSNGWLVPTTQEFNLDDSYLYLIDDARLTRVKLPSWLVYQDYYDAKTISDEQKQRIIDYLLNEQQLGEPWRALFTKNAPQETQE